MCVCVCIDRRNTAHVIRRWPMTVGRSVLIVMRRNFFLLCICNPPFQYTRLCRCVICRRCCSLDKPNRAVVEDGVTTNVHRVVRLLSFLQSYVTYVYVRINNVSCHSPFFCFTLKWNISFRVCTQMDVFFRHESLLKRKSAFPEFSNKNK